MSVFLCDGYWYPTVFDSTFLGVVGEGVDVARY